VEALALILASLAKKGKRGAKAPIKTSASQAPHSASARGRKRNSVEVMADHALIDIGAGTSDELPFVIRQSFKNGRYSPSTGMKETEWQIMLE
jgi:hypothetical protein